MDEALEVKQTKMSIFLNKVVDFAKKFVVPFVIALVILFTSGHARTTSRQGDFNRFVLIVLFAITVVFIAIALIKTPANLYKSFLHPIKNKVYKNKLIYTVAIPIIALAVFALLYYYKGNSLETVGHYLLLIAFGFTFALTVKFKTFVEYFNKVLLFLAIFSLVFFFIGLKYKGVMIYTSSFNSVNDISYRSVLDLYFGYVIQFDRNCGPFWEPGIYSLVLIIGIVFELLIKKKPNLIYILVFAGTIISTLSTSGVILLVCTAPLYFAKKKSRIPFYISVVLAAAIIWFFIYLGDPSHNVPFFTKAFSKLFASSSNAGSYKTRLDSPFYGFDLFLKSHGLGYGPNIFDEKYELLRIRGNTATIAQTSTFGWLIGSFGIIGMYFVIVSMICLFWYFFKKNNLRTSLFVIAFVVVMLNCEPMYAFSIFWVLAMYPIAHLIKKSCVKQGFTESLTSSVSKSGTGTKLTFTNLSGSLVIKVLVLVVGLFTYPLYVKYFANLTPIADVTGNTTHGAIALGAWLVILQILSWVLTFDIGIGNGLKNKIVEAINENRRDDVRKYISCSYITNLAITMVLLVVGVRIIDIIDFNNLLNISTQVIPLTTLQAAFKLAYISICLEFFFKIVLNIYQALQKEVVASSMSLISTILLLIFVSLAKYESMGDALIAVSAFYIFSINVPLIILTIVLFSTTLKDCTPTLKKWSFPVAKSIITLGGLYFIIQILLLIINSTNKVIISRSYGASIVTEYEPYLKIFSALTAIGSAISLPMWTLVLRADVKKDYAWMKKSKKMILGFLVLFTIGALLIAALLQLIFNLWLGDETIKVDYFKAFMFAAWSIFTIASYFASAYSNGLKILKPQLLIYGVGALVKIPVFLLIKKMVPDISWIVLIIIDAGIMLIAASSMFVLNHIAIKKRMKNALKEVPAND